MCNLTLGRGKGRPTVRFINFESAFFTSTPALYDIVDERKQS
jgi:hypothetical protein